MEPWLLGIFLLFSIVSALLERRKRRAQLAEAQRRQREQPGGEPRPQVADEDDVEEEEWGGWPFPRESDPFERPRPVPPRRAEPQSGGEVDVAEAAPATSRRSLIEELERQARESEQRVEEQEARLRERQRQLQQVRPARRMSEMLRERASASKPQEPVEGRQLTARGWQLSAAAARDAVVYAEILGPCRAVKELDMRG